MPSLVLPNGAKISYSTFGVETGQPVLFMHGFTGTAASHFANEIQLLAPHAHIIAPDLRGYGQSTPPYREFGPDFYQRDADDMFALLTHLQLTNVTVIGFSDGAESALLLAATAPSLIARVIVWGVCGQISNEMVQRVRRWLPVEDWGDDRSEWKSEIIANHGVAQFKPMIEGWVNAAEAISQRGGDIAFHCANRIHSAVTIIHGQQDIGNPIPVVQQLAAQIPQCELHILDGIGHSIQDEAPTLLHPIILSALYR
ncbi:MAG: alpha/beta fold hydrolase [Roseiflexaceae bacterium]